MVMLNGNENTLVEAVLSEDGRREWNANITRKYRDCIAFSRFPRWLRYLRPILNYDRRQCDARAVGFASQREGSAQRLGSIDNFLLGQGVYFL